MELGEIAAISGKPGLYKVIKPTRTSIILETLDDHKQKFVAGPSSKVSVLKEISIYTLSKEGSTPLETILKSIYKVHKGILNIASNASGADLFSFAKTIIPDIDESRVYPSDLKKLVSWYNIIVKAVPEMLEEKVEEPAAKAETPTSTAETTENANAETTPEAKPKKAKAKASEIVKNEDEAPKSKKKAAPKS